MMSEISYSYFGRTKAHAEISSKQGYIQHFFPRVTVCVWGLLTHTFVLFLCVYIVSIYNMCVWPPFGWLQQ